MNIRDTEMTEALLEKSMDLLAAIMKFYSACLNVFQQGFLGAFPVSNRFTDCGQ